MTKPSNTYPILFVSIASALALSSCGGADSEGTEASPPAKMAEQDQALGKIGIASSQTVRPGDSPPSGYTLCATEGQECTFRGTANVIYGAASTWTAPRSVTGNVPCNNNTFTDNIFLVVKACYVATASIPAPTPAPAPAPAPLGIGHPLTSGFSVGLSNAEVYSTDEQAPSSWDSTGNFRTVCKPVTMDYVDPIVFPGQKNAFHLHTFFGNTAVSESSTSTSLRAAGNAACRGGTINRSAYWVPAMIDTRTNLAVMPEESDFYYKTGYLGVLPADVKPFPRGLRMIAGDPRNTNPAASHTDGFSFNCHAAGTQRGSSIPNCEIGDEVDQTILFPQCWDGINEDSPDHKSHMAYASPPNGCPASHPVPLPEIAFHIKYKITQANQSTYWKLSSDRPGVPAGYSSHGDWMNGWNEAIVKTWVENCLNTARDCHSHLLGDGRAMGGEF